MWRALHRFRSSGYHFRKQAAIGPYVVDFVCHHAALVIEVDGEQHDAASERARDLRRDVYLRNRGYAVLRVSTADLMGDTWEAVEKQVSAVLEGKPPRVRPTPSRPLPARGRVSAGISRPMENMEAPSSAAASPRNTSPPAGEVGRGVSHARDRSGRSGRMSAGISRPMEDTAAPSFGAAGPRNTSPLAGEVAQPGATRPGEARRGVPHAASSYSTSPLAGEVAEPGATRRGDARRGVPRAGNFEALTPSPAPLGPDGPSSATLPARGRVVDSPEASTPARSPAVSSTSPLAGEVAELGAKRRGDARRGVQSGTSPASLTPSPAPLGPDGPSSAPLPARGRVEGGLND
jgi:very-short-patch-repair endonuclease